MNAVDKVAEINEEVKEIIEDQDDMFAEDFVVTMIHLKLELTDLMDELDSQCGGRDGQCARKAMSWGYEILATIERAIEAMNK